MFTCGCCGRIVPPGIKCTEIITKKRKREYDFREGVNRMSTWKQDRTERFQSTNDNGGVGWEAAETKKACPQCVKSLEMAEKVEPVVRTI
jgi:hypothetical protein